MGNAYFSLSVFILFLLILIGSNSCFASDQTTSNIPSLHDGNASTKLASTTSYNTKIRSDDPKEVDNRGPFGGRKMRGDKSAMVVRSLSDNEEHVKTSSTKKHYYINNVKGGDEKEDSKYEANSKSTNGGKRIRGHNQKTTTTDMDSFVACADYPSPHHHPPKNN